MITHYGQGMCKSLDKSNLDILYHCLVFHVIKLTEQPFNKWHPKVSLTFLSVKCSKLQLYSQVIQLT